MEANERRTPKTTDWYKIPSLNTTSEYGYASDGELARHSRIIDSCCNGHVSCWCRIAKEGGLWTTVERLGKLKEQGGQQRVSSSRAK